METQGDLFIRQQADLIIKDNPALEAIDKMLPDNPYLKPYQIKRVIPVCEDVIYTWIQQFKFDYIDVGTGDKVARYAIERKSFLKFLATRVNVIR